MQKLSAELAVPIKIVSTAVIGRPIGKTTGKYIGTMIGTVAGEFAGQKLAEVLVPAIFDAPEPGYVRVDVREDHRPPRFFERMMDH